MTKPTWTHTHNGENNEELCCCEGKYYTRFAWDHFGAAYTGHVRPAHRDRPLKFLGSDTDFSVAPANIYPRSPGTASTTDPLDWADLFPDEPTDPMPQPVIRPGKLIASFPLKKKDKP